MLKSNFKKLVSAVSAAAMVSSLAVPVAMAEEDAVLSAEEIISSEEIAELAANDTLIAANDFESAQEGSILTLSNVAQDPYTELSPAIINIGSMSQATPPATETGSSIKSGVGVGGSKALVFNSDTQATTNKSSSMTFDIPETRDNFMVSFMVYPTAEQECYYSEGTATAPTAANAMGLNKEEWNTVEIYVTRKGRIINVNGEKTILSDTSVTAPAIWGYNQSKKGEIYFDNVELHVLTALPTAIPTPSPEPVPVMGIGDGTDFEEYDEGAILTLGTAAQTYDKMSGFMMRMGNRANGGTATTAISIGKGKDGKGLVLQYGRFSSTNRGGSIQLLTPEVASGEFYQATFDAKLEHGAEPGMDLFVGSSLTTNDGTALGLPANTWVPVNILMANGTRIILVNNKVANVGASYDLPVLWGPNLDLSEGNPSKVTIDNYKISSVSDEEYINALAGAIDITNEEETVYKYGDIYNFISSFNVPSAVVGSDISWAAYQSDNGTDWVNAEDIKITGTRVTAASVDPAKTYKLTATVTDGVNVGTNEFVLKYIPKENVLDTVLERLEIADKTTVKTIEKKETADGVQYVVRGDFSVPIKDWVVNYTWTASDPNVMSIDREGGVVIYPISDASITLTATASYAGESKSKNFTLNLANYYTQQQDKVNEELANSVVYAKGTDGQQLGSVTLADGAVIPFDVDLKTVTASDKNLAISWKTSDKDVLTTDGVINVDNKNAKDVTLTKTVTYKMGGKNIYSGSKDFKVKVQFNPDATDEASKAKADEYAKAKVAEAVAKAESPMTQAQQDALYASNYNSAMEVLSDRYKTRFDAKYEGNWENIPSEVDDDFELDTTGYFGSKITWGSSDTCLKINGSEVKYTKPSTDKKVTLKATFTSGASVNADAAKVTVNVEGKSSSKSSGGGGSSSGGGNSYKGSLGYVTPVTATPVPANPDAPSVDVTLKAEFADLDQASWAAVAITELANKGIVSGRNAVTFAPNDNITRAEFAKIIAGAFNVPAGEASFTDVASTDWYAPYVGACYAAGIITGYEDGSFAPNALVTRQDMAVMVMRAAAANGVEVPGVNEKIDFADADQIAAYAADAVAALQQGGIINGMTADTFAPTETATRAQAAKILYSFCN